MDNNELRLEIAKAKGWTKLHPHCNNPHKHEILDGLEGEWPEHTFLVEIPNWPASISDALELILETPRMQINYYHVSKRKDFEPLWTVRINMMDTLEFRAATAPRAICLAWLAWKEIA